MTGFVVDTNVLSEFSKTGEPNQWVKSWLGAALRASLYVSVLTLAESAEALSYFLEQATSPIRTLAWE